MWLDFIGQSFRKWKLYIQGILRALESLLNTKACMNRVKLHRPGRKWLEGWKLNNSQGSQQRGSRPISQQPEQSPCWSLRAFSREPSGSGLNNKVKECLEKDYSRSTSKNLKKKNLKRVQRKRT